MPAPADLRDRMIPLCTRFVRPRLEIVAGRAAELFQMSRHDGERHDTPDALAQFVEEPGVVRELRALAECGS
jgi:hypothetical protein